LLVLRAGADPWDPWKIPQVRKTVHLSPETPVYSLRFGGYASPDWKTFHRARLQFPFIAFLPLSMRLFQFFFHAVPPRGLLTPLSPRFCVSVTLKAARSGGQCSASLPASQEGVWQLGAMLSKISLTHRTRADPIPFFCRESVNMQDGVICGQTQDKIACIASPSASFMGIFLSYLCEGRA